MALASGTRVGPYEVVAPLGAGGMGEVYRARDTKLGREVAIKVLSDGFIHDPERVARFQREAQLLASLNHPHIATIHGLEETSGSQFLVMELVEGETLSERLRSGPLAVSDALVVARQVADALQAAHEKGIIHRDLKPANIAFTATGQVKVLDFGLAKALDPAGVGRDFSPAGSEDPAYIATHSPTLSLAATQAGVILGTAAYMAPEQARGKAADKRCDVWAFGCVLYEMLAGKKTFEGIDMADTLAAVLRSDPDWNALPAATPSSIRALVRGCLEKDRQARIADIAAALFVLKDPSVVDGAPASIDSPSAAKEVAGAGAAVRLWWRVAVLTAGAVAVAAVASGAVWFATRPAPPRVSRTTISTSDATALNRYGSDRDVAVTPDGSRVVYRGSNGQIFVRALDQLDPTPIAGLGNPHGLFTSPDGQWIGFFDSGVLKKVAITGGPPVTIAMTDATGEGSAGATWGDDGTIIYATSAPSGLQRVPAVGGDPSILTTPNRQGGESDHLWPVYLPGGRAVLFTVTATGGELAAAQVVVMDLQTGTRKILVRGGSDGRYVSSGHLVYAAGGTLRGVRFDLNRLEAQGTPVPVASGIATTNNNGVNASIAASGMLAYVMSGNSTMIPLGGAAVSNVRRTLVWVDRQGREAPIAVPPQTYDQPRVSPDGARIAVHSDDQQRDIWIWDVERTTFTRVTFDPALDNYPLWTPDGRRVIFSSARSGAVRDLYWQSADGTGAPESLVKNADRKDATGVSPDGRQLVFTEISPGTSEDVMQVTLDGMHRVTPLVQTSFRERNGVISPDGRWLAYEANDSGRLEIYVRPYPDVNAGRWQVSPDGGERPLWSRNGRELFYVSRAGAIMGVGVGQSPSWTSTTPAMVVKEGYLTNPMGLTARMYDISPDGQRFVMVKNPPEAQQTAVSNLIVVQNWAEELKRLVPR